MKIHAEMDLDELVRLMGRRTVAGFSGSATRHQAFDLREMLVRDFAGKDTDAIAGETWHLYCCAVDPEEQIA
jgi:hypothetical protein